VLARNATYSGKQWSYKQALEVENRTMPVDATWETNPPVMPDKEGNYKLPMPADYKLA